MQFEFGLPTQAALSLPVKCKTVIQISFNTEYNMKGYEE